MQPVQPKASTQAPTSSEGMPPATTQSPIVYYVTPPTTTCIFIPFQTQQPAMQNMSVAVGAPCTGFQINAPACAGMASPAASVQVPLVSVSPARSDAAHSDSNCSTPVMISHEFHRNHYHHNHMAAQPSASSSPFGALPQQPAALGGAAVWNERMQHQHSWQTRCELGTDGTQTATTADGTLTTNTQLSQPSHHEDRMSPEVSSSGSAHSSSLPPSRRGKKKSRTCAVDQQAAAESHRRGQYLADLILQQKSNYTRRLEAGGESAAAAIAELYGAVLPLSLDVHGCRLMQLAIEKAQGVARARLCEELRGHVRQAMGSPHANHVIQKIVQVMPVEIAEFVARELMGITPDACRHRHGCRIMCRLIEQFGGSAASVVQLEKEVIASEVVDLALHSFGRRVIQAILEHGSPTHKSMIVTALAKDLFGNATNRNGSYVIETALRYCSEGDAAMLVAKVIAEDSLLALSQHPFGIFVVRALMGLRGSLSARVSHDLYSAPPEVQANEHFQRLLKHLEAVGKDDVVDSESSR